MSRSTLMPRQTLPIQYTEQLLRERIALFRELCRRASPRQIQIALYLVRLHFCREQAPSAFLDADIESVQNAIDSGRWNELELPSLH